MASEGLRCVNATGLRGGVELSVSALALERLRGVFDAEVLERLRVEVGEVDAALLVFVAGAFL